MEVAELERIQSRQAVEERIGGSGRQHFVPRIAEQLEQVGVGLARRCRQEEVLRRHGISWLGKSGGERLARFREALRMRVILRGGAAAEELAQLLLGVRQT